MVLHRRPVPEPAGRAQHDRCRSTSRTPDEQTRQRYEGKLHLLDQLEPPVRGRLHEGGVDDRSTTRSTRQRRWTSRSLYTRETPQDLFTLSYNGILSPQFFVEGRFSARHFTLHRQRLAVHRPASTARCCSTARAAAALLVADLLRRLRPEKRDNDNEFVKATYFLSTKGCGSHQMVFGYDTFNDKRFANNHQSGSDYRILGTTHDHPRTGVDLPAVAAGRRRRRAPVQPDRVEQPGHELPDALAVLQRQLAREQPPDAQPRRCATTRTTARTAPATWSRTTARSARASARLGSDGRRRVVGHGELREVRRRAHQQHRRLLVGGRQPGDVPVDLHAARRSTPTRTRRRRRWFRPLQAIQQVFDWCDADCARLLHGRQRRRARRCPAFDVKIPDGLSSPNVLAYAGGVSRQVGSRAVVRADYSYRDYRDFYSQRIDRPPAA